jgi:hypothetical protein
MKRSSRRDRRKDEKKIQKSGARHQTFFFHDVRETRASEHAVRSVQRFCTLSFTEIFPSGPFTAKLFFLLPRFQLKTTSEFLTFRYATTLQSEKESPTLSCCRR